MKSPDPFLECARTIQRLTHQDGVLTTSLPFLTFIRSSESKTLGRGMLKPSVCFIVQGQKRVQLGGKDIIYGVGDYLAAAIHIPMSGQSFNVTPKKPYLGVRIELDAKEIASIVLDAKIKISSKAKPVAGAYVSTANDDLKDAVLKLVHLSEQPEDAAFLGIGLKREIIYRILKAPEGHLLYENAMMEHQKTGISLAMEWIQDHYMKPLKMEALARLVNMSVSSLHHKFKAVTTMGPLQYQKQLRLQEARKLLFSGTLDASHAAYQVGYESLSQFSREYRRFFGAPPIKDIQALKAKMSAPLQD